MNPNAPLIASLEQALLKCLTGVAEAQDCNDAVLWSAAYRDLAAQALIDEVKALRQTVEASLRYASGLPPAESQSG